MIGLSDKPPDRHRLGDPCGAGLPSAGGRGSPLGHGLVLELGRARPGTDLRPSTPASLSCDDNALT